MTLDQLLQTPPELIELDGLWLVFDAELNDRLMQAQPHYQHQVAPLALTDGRFAVGADLLTEVNGLYAATFAALDHSVFPAVQVIDQELITPLTPAPSTLES
jgi:hypothetical protein